jgi:hypothetical protein
MFPFPGYVKRATSGRETLTAARDYYVRTDGSDSNTGLANTAGGAFLTIQKGIDTAAALDVSIYDVDINVADGTYTGANILKSPVGSGVVNIIGNTATPANVAITVTSGTCFSGNIKSRFFLKGMTLSTVTSGSGVDASGPGAVTLENVNFGTILTTGISVSEYCTVTVGTNYTIAGNCLFHWIVTRQGTLICRLKTVTLTGTPAWGGGFLFATQGGMAEVDGNTFSGSRWTVTTMALIDTAGGGATYLPGNVAGTTTAPGAYV